MKLNLCRYLRHLLARFIPHRAATTRRGGYSTYRADGCDYVIPTPDPVAEPPRKAKP